MATIQLTEDDGFFKTDSKGRDVFQWRVSRQFGVKVGDTIEAEGRTFVVAAKGDEFTIGKNNAKWAYLYAAVPAAVPAVRATETPDDPMERLEQARQQAFGQSGELPGA